jgi:hypothetical protein
MKAFQKLIRLLLLLLKLITSDKVIKILAISILFFCTQKVYGQYNDARLWLSANVQKKLNRKTSLLFSESVRMYENYSQLGQVYSDFGLRHKLSKNWRIAVHYRYSKRRQNVVSNKNIGDEIFRNGHRFYADIIYKHKVGNMLDFSFRGRYQRQYIDPFTSLRGNRPKSHLRLKLTMNIDFGKRYKPYVAGELYYQLSNTVYKNRFDRTRYFAGILYDIDKRKQIDIHYMLIRGYNINVPIRYYVLSLNYYYSF